jgi:hypothetical protein
LARVVSKWVLFGTTSPGLHSVENRIRSAARPWCVGSTWRNPKMSCTAASKRNHDRLPAYASSPRMTEAHCSELIAAVPLSVSRSISTSSARSRKAFQWAVRSFCSRSARVVSRIGSTDLILKGSMMVRMGGKDSGPPGHCFLSPEMFDIPVL